MTVGELLKALAGVDPAMPVVVQATGNEGDDVFVCGVEKVAVSSGCAAWPALTIVADEEADLTEAETLWVKRHEKEDGRQLRLVGPASEESK